jgi:hypothetical protein
LSPLGDAFISVAVGFFYRGSSAMMTFLVLGFGGSELFLAGSLVIVFLLAFVRNFLVPDNLTNGANLSHIVLAAMAAGAQSYQIIRCVRT